MGTARDGRAPRRERRRVPLRPAPPFPFSLMFFEQAREHAEQEYAKNKRDTQVGRGGGGARRWMRARLRQAAPPAACPATPPHPPSNHPPNRQALTRWGGALLELAHFCQGGEAYEKIQQVRRGGWWRGARGTGRRSGSREGRRGGSGPAPRNPRPALQPSRHPRARPQAIDKFDEALAIDPRKHDALWCLGNAFTSQGFLTADAGAAAALFTRAASAFKRALAEDPTSDVYRKALEMTAKAPALHAELQKQLHASQTGGGGGGGGGKARSASAATPTADLWWDVAGWVALGAIVVGVVALTRGGPTPATA